MVKVETSLSELQKICEKKFTQKELEETLFNLGSETDLDWLRKYEEVIMKEE